MKERIKKIGRFIAQGTLSLLAFGIILLALLQIFLMIGFAAFNTGKGRSFVEARLQSALAESGYGITIETLFYDPVRGLTVYDVALSDKDGVFATLDRLSIGVVFEKLFVRDLEIFSSGGTLAFSRFPHSEEKPSSSEDKKDLEPFALPDMYVHRVGIDYFTMKSIVLPSADPSIVRALSPTLRGEVLLSDTATLDVTLVTRPSPDLKAAQVPENITVKGSFNPADLALSLKQLQITAENYNIEGNGTGNFGSNGNVDFALIANHKNLAFITQDNLKEADLNIVLNGSSAAPQIKLEGTIVPLSLADKGLTDIEISALITDMVSAPKTEANIATSYQEQPITLDANILYNAPSINIETVKLEAPFADLNGSGVYDLEKALADIKIDATIEKLSHYSALAGIDLSGSLKSTVQAKPRDGKQSVAVNAIIDNGQYSTIKIRKMNADLSFPDIFASYWPSAADVKISSLALSNDLSVSAADISLKQSENDAYRLSLNANGSMGKPFSLKGSSRIESFTTPLPTLSGIDFSLGLRRASINLKGSLNPEAVDLSIVTKDLKAADLPIDVSGNMRRIAIDGKVLMSGSPASPVTTGDIKISGLTRGKYEDLTLNLDAKHESGTANAKLSGNGTGIRKLNADATLPLTFALSPFAFSFDKDAALKGDIVADIDLGPISSLFLQPTQIVTGTLNADGDISGTLSSPLIKGNASIDKASFNDEQNGIELDGIIVKSRFTQDAINVTTLQATDGENGTLNGSGNISFGESGTNLSLSTTNFHLPKGNMANGYFDAQLGLRDSGKSYEATGKIDIRSMDILIPETFQSQIPELNIVKRGEENKDNAGKLLLLDIDVHADNQFFVRGWGLDAEFGGTIEINGSADEPLLEGSFKARRGRYEEFGKRFDLARANLRFQGAVPPSPYLDIEATTDAEDVVASVLLTGPVQKPEIAFSSVPALPQDEVLARILFGKSATKISAFQAVQLAQTVQRFSGQGGGGLDPLGMLRNLTGLDDISVETDSEGQTNVGVGKYLSDNVYLEFERGAGEASGGANLQIEVSPEITIESEIGQDAQGGGGVFWKRDY